MRRHPDGRRLATLLATVRFLEGKSVDDTLELLDLLMATELVNKAQNASSKEKVRKHPKLAKSATRLAVAVEALFESDGWGGPEEPRVAEVWEAIEAVISRAELRAALVLVNDSVPPADADPDDWRTELTGRYATVSGFLKVLPEVIEFGANAEGTPVLEAMKALPDVLAHRSRLPAPLIPGRLVDAGVVNGPWKRLVFGHPVRDDGSANRHGEHTERSLILDLALALAEDRRRDITRKTKDGLEAARKRGLAMGRRGRLGVRVASGKFWSDITTSGYVRSADGADRGHGLDGGKAGPRCSGVPPFGEWNILGGGWPASCMDPVLRPQPGNTCGACDVASPGLSHSPSCTATPVTRTAAPRPSGCRPSTPRRRA
ncbi:MAG: hypothetical protein ACRDOL_28785 [Streptosporangiaceae bacterium]